MRPIYLVQRAQVIHPAGPVDRGVTALLDLDYMGSAEFEFGALPKSMRAFDANKDIVKHDKITHIVNEREQQLRVIHFMDNVKFAAYANQLQRLRTDPGFRCKELPRFAVGQTKPDCDFWWDIENHVMWTFDKHAALLIMQYIESSVAHFNRR